MLGGAAFPGMAKEGYGVGRAATGAEIKAWDIDVRPDFKGLPRGSGTLDQGADVWDSNCASCHGSFGESNSVFSPIVGGTTNDDIISGRVAALAGNNQPARTTFMKVSSISTLWDYIYRAMPWDAPKSLSPDEVYAVLAYLLNLAEIVPDDFTLSDQNIAQVQEKMPNRNGMVFWEGLWKVDGKPDTSNVACMSGCEVAQKPSSVLPDYVRAAHGDLAGQMRIIGPVRGVNTEQPALAGKVDAHADAVRKHARATLTQASGGNEGKAAAAGGDDQKTLSILAENGCMACHARDQKVLGPSFVDIAKKYKGQEGSMEVLLAKLKNGGGGVWGAIPMPPQPGLSDADAKAMLEWILATAN
jgi:cytochrome c